MDDFFGCKVQKKAENSGKQKVGQKDDQPVRADTAKHENSPDAHMRQVQFKRIGSYERQYLVQLCRMQPFKQTAQ